MEGTQQTTARANAPANYSSFEGVFSMLLSSEAPGTTIPTPHATETDSSLPGAAAGNPRQCATPAAITQHTGAQLLPTTARHATVSNQPS